MKMWTNSKGVSYYKIGKNTLKIIIATYTHRRIIDSRKGRGPTSLE
jgi:hypothetical protein